MKRTLIVASVAALAFVGMAGTANAASSANCFGQVHKTVNTQGLAGAENVGQLIKVLGGGQEKNAAATALFCS